MPSPKPTPSARMDTTETQAKPSAPPFGGSGEGALSAMLQCQWLRENAGPKANQTRADASPPRPHRDKLEPRETRPNESAAAQPPDD